MDTLGQSTSEFISHISVAVWIGRLTDEAAREMLLAYAAANRRSLGSKPGTNVEDAILAEYRHRREGQDLSS